MKILLFVLIALVKASGFGNEVLEIVHRTEYLSGAFNKKGYDLYKSKEQLPWLMAIVRRAKQWEQVIGEALGGVYNSNGDSD